MGNAAKVLILSPFPSQSGGVIDYVGMLKGNLPQSVKVDSFFTGNRPLHKMAKPFSFLLPVVDAVRLLCCCMNNRYDVVHINPSLNKAILRDSLFMLVLRLFGVSRAMVFMHGWNDEWARRIFSSQILRSVFLLIWGGAGRILVLASRFKKLLVDAGFNSDSIIVVATMFDSAQFAGLESRRTESITQILFLSRFVREKGVYELLEGFSKVADRYPNVQLICAGDGPEAEGMRNWVSSRGLGHQILFPGFMRGARKAQLLMDANVFAFPTYYGEGCPVALLEAMAAGCAVITGDAGGIPDIFRDGTNGIMLARPTGESVGAALAELLSDPERCNAIGEGNHASASVLYDAKNASAAIATVYSEVAGINR